MTIAELSLPPNRSDDRHRGADPHPATPAGNLPTLMLFPAGTEIYVQGEKCRNFYQVEFGAVRVHRLSADGRRQILAFHLAGETFGLEPSQTHHFFAEATCATGIRVRRAAPMQDHAAEDLLPMALTGLVRAQEHLLVLGRQNSLERVAAFLLEMSERQGGLSEVELPMSRMDIADYLGLTIETVSRSFSKLRQKGIIRLSSMRSVEFVRPQSLCDMVAG
ncbi:MAG: helix-turn-helix domain-containing protein [Rhizobiales bacterium]|nr:helix-turn-helix domain-containing protein [Hyphomicrobiales bacterium]MBN9010733.1 helix-turn-helix domain-containing protein [Hyphomicrobiales bacterium]